MKMLTKQILAKFIKGILIGIGTIIPGVSGGTVAILAGEFDNILKAVSGITSHLRKSIFILLPIAIGAACGVFITSYPLGVFCEKLPVISKYVFCLIAMISGIFFVVKTKIHKLAFKNSIFIVFGAITALLISILVDSCKMDLANAPFVVIFFIGFPLALALVLPAISFSYMLLFFGIYEKTIEAISSLDITYLLSLGSGVIIGSYIFSKLLLKIIETHSNEAYSCVFGFLIYSIADILL